MRNRHRVSEEPSYLRTERLLVLLFSFFLSLTLAHFVHEGWARVFPKTAAPQLSSSRESTSAAQIRYAPDAYRVAVPAAIRLLSGPPLNANLPDLYAAFDFVFSAGALLLLARFTVRDIAATQVNRGPRALNTALFFAFAQFPLAWVVPWQRPETMPSAFFLSIALWCIAKANEGFIWTALLLVATLLQALVRTDVPFVFGCGVVLASLMSGLVSESRSRRLLLSRGLGVAVVAGATQVYLQFIKFPGLRYAPGVPLVTIRWNLLPHNLSNGLLALLPLLIGVVPAIWGWHKTPVLHRAILFSSALYLGLWMTVAILDEVRVYVPFLMMLCVVAARTVSQRLLPAMTEDRQVQHIEARN